MVAAAASIPDPAPPVPAPEPVEPVSIFDASDGPSALSILSDFGGLSSLDLATASIFWRTELARTLTQVRSLEDQRVVLHQHLEFVHQQYAAVLVRIATTHVPRKASASASSAEPSQAGPSQAGPSQAKHARTTAPRKAKGKGKGKAKARAGDVEIIEVIELSEDYEAAIESVWDGIGEASDD
jgi:hypothetical protein